MKWRGGLWGAIAVFVTAASGLGQVARRDIVTAHYELTAWGTEAEVEGWGKVLEQTWPEVEFLLLARPELGGKRLGVRVFADKEAWKEGLLAERQAVPPKADPCWFSPFSKVVYLYRQPSPVFTRMMLVYGAVLQFHALCKAKNMDLDTAWYVHGLAHVLSVHHWDGVKVQLGVQPRLSVVDHPAKALAALGGEKAPWDPWREEVLADPYVSWAAVRFALYGEKAKYRAKYQKLALGHTGSKLSALDFQRALGREKDVTPEFRAWLLAEQLPFEVLHGDWEEKPDGRIVGGAGEGEVVAVTLREPRSVLSGVAHGLTGKGGEACLALAWIDEKNHVLGRVAPPFFVAEFVRDGQQVDQERYALPNPRADAVVFEMRRLETKAGAIKKKIAERPGAVAVTLDGKALGRIEVFEGRIGLAVVGGRAEFSQVRFE
jgi:hypothetical protein